MHTGAFGLIHALLTKVLIADVLCGMERELLPAGVHQLEA